MSSRTSDKLIPNQAPANISKSVARAFAVLELFRSRQTPMLAEMRQAGHSVGYDIYLQGVGAVCVSTAIGDQPAVVAVAGDGDRIRANEQEILRVIRKHLRRLAHP